MRGLRELNSILELGKIPEGTFSLLDDPPEAKSSTLPPENFEGPALNPAPVPDFDCSGEFIDFWSFLEWMEPIGDAAMLAFQVSQLTAGMANLKQRIEELEHGRGE